MTEDFGSNKEKNVLVRDLMTVGVPTCSPETSVCELARIMLEKQLDTLVVLEGGEGHALGIVSQEDLVQAFQEDNVKDLKAEDVMQENVPQIPPDIPLSAAVKIMGDMGVRALFLMHHAGGIEYPAALISYRHILRYLAARNAKELSDLGIQAERRTPLEIFIERRDSAKKRV